jgi:hypothetical protein
MIFNESKSVSDCNDTLDIVLELEGGELVINTMEELNQLKSVCRTFASSQGFYGRLLRDLETVTEDDLPIIL